MDPCLGRLTWELQHSLALCWYCACIWPETAFSECPTLDHSVRRPWLVYAVPREDKFCELIAMHGRCANQIQVTNSFKVRARGYVAL